MSLRRQLMLVSLLLLTLPWSGCQFVREMESALQQDQSDSLQASSQALATVIGKQPGLLYPDGHRLANPGDISQQLYASATSAPMIVDGYADGWNDDSHGQWGPVSYRAKTHNGRLYLLFDIEDDKVVYHDPRITNYATGDRLVLRTGLGASYVIASAGPGPVQARVLEGGKISRWDARIRGHWQDRARGYSLELEMPLSLTGDRLGFYLVDVSRAGSKTYGNIELRQRGLPPWLIYPSPALTEMLAPFGSDDLSLDIVDLQRWRVGHSGSLEQHEDQPPCAASTLAAAKLVSLHPEHDTAG